MTEKNKQSTKKIKPLVTIILRAYNQETFILEAMEGVFSQTYEPLEILISDDASTDGTFEIIKESVIQYKGPHTIRVNQNTQNLGIGSHLGFSAGLASGEYIVMADGDDISLPNRVEKLMDVVFEYGELGAVFGRYHAFSDQFVDEGNWKPDHAKDGYIIRGRNPADWFTNSKKGKVVGMPGGVGMWNKKLFKDFSPLPPGVIAGDFILGCRALFSGLGVGFTSAKMVHYRNHESNIYNGVRRELWEKRVFFSKAVIYRDLMEYRKKNPDVYSKEVWDQIFCYFETMLFRSTVILRRIFLGRFWSRVLFLIGLK